MFRSADGQVHNTEAGAVEINDRMVAGAIIQGLIALENSFTESLHTRVKYMPVETAIERIKRIYADAVLEVEQKARQQAAVKTGEAEK